MAGNTVTLTFAGDADKLARAAKKAEKTLTDVGKAAQHLNMTVSDATKGVSASFGKMGDGVDIKSKGVMGKVTQFASGLVDAMGQAAGKLGGILSNITEGLPPLGKPVALALGAGLAAALAPIIGAAISSAVLLGVGGGALALGIKSAVADPKVKAAFGGLKEQASEVFKEFGEPFKAPLIRATKTFGGVLDRVRPAINRIGQIIARVIDKLAPALGEFFERAMPGIEKAVQAAKPLFDTLAANLPKIGEALNQFFSKIAGEGDNANEFFDDMLGLVAGLIVVFGDVIAKLASWYDDLKRFIRAGKDRFTEFKAAVVNHFADILEGATAALGWMPGLGPKLKAANDKFRQFRIDANKELQAVKDRQVMINVWSNVGSVVANVASQLSRLPSIGRQQPRKFHSGGIVPGPVGTEVPAILQAGETVIPAGGRSGSTVLEIRSGGTQLDDLLLEILSRAVRRRGGNVQLVLGGRNA